MGSFADSRRTTASTICIIGAGPSGLAAAKYLAAEKYFARITVFEQRQAVGGTWNHVPCPTDAIRALSIPQTRHTLGHEKPIPAREGQFKNEDGSVSAPEFMSPIYDRLETNIPRGLMGFSDLRWDEDCQLFPGHEAVLRYIEKYAEDVLHLIQFCTQVLDVRLNSDGRWTVQTQGVSQETVGGDISTEVFDAVIVANGHFNVPHIPPVDGIERWNTVYPGSITHSKLYRSPESYRGQKVVVVGNSASGIDIGAQIATACKLPLLVSRKSKSYLQTGPSPAIVEKPEIVEYLPQNRSIRFADGSIESDIDSIVYCTGYFYSFPFLKSMEPLLLTNGERVHNLYQHIFFQDHPTLAFLVLNQKVIPFPLAEVQSAVIAQVFAGRLDLPPASEMAAWEEETQKETGGGRMFHVLHFPKDANYINMLHDWWCSARPKNDRPTNQALDSAGIHSKSNATQRANGGVGKFPPRWGEEEYWTRERFPAIKKAFQDYGEERHVKRTLQEVGFDFEAWKRKEHDR